ncbi:Adaptor protein complex AP-3 delta subunit [Athelia psychrophila]|uniref:AP-3 complex subunit delta n=1 Tax=Athelia psychrophila TaxID=1759441 RepID=A0A166S197_9AGAM|nr:Adaptor protein complex AP-3 delta subunit [Fibularhizoctonia sp. CBS 109695]
MWERTLQDLIRGLRANKADESKFIATALDEIRREVRSKDMQLKAGAVLKLTYLEMLGYDMSWASFNVLEVMSSPRIHLKSVGYLAAVQSFTQDTDVMMLTTNTIKKDLASTPADIAVTLNGLSHIVTPDLARDLSPELIAMLTHSRAHIRKRAILAMYKVLAKYPEAAPNGLPRLRERLEDADPGVVAATANVLCELARRNPRDYLPLAPQLFQILTTSSNNWMLIKIVKLFGSLSPHEPRLVKKLQSPITNLISTTPAISLLYECVHTCIIGGMLEGSSGYALAQTCVSKLAAFIEDADQNLKYIALMAMAKIIPSHPELIAQYQDTILASIDDQDISIRMRALDLVSAMANRDNLQSIVQQLLSHLVRSGSSSVLPTAAQSLAQSATATSASTAMPPATQSPAYRLVLSQRILDVCSQDTYENVTDFEWYLSVLVDLSYVANVNVGARIRDQLVDVIGRVRAVRPYAVKLMVKLLGDDNFVEETGDEGSCAEVLWAAAWICGEGNSYASAPVNPTQLLTYLLQPSIARLAFDIVAVYIHAATKVFGQWASHMAEGWADGMLTDVKAMVDMVIERVTPFSASPHIEVQERAANTLQLFAFIQRDLSTFRPRPANGLHDDAASTSSFDPIAEPHFPKSLYLIRPLFNSHELNPVARAAQASVPVPEGLDLDAWIVPSQQRRQEEQEDAAAKAKKSKKGKGKETNGTKSAKSGKRRQREEDLVDSYPPPEPEVETAEERAERERLKAERLERMKDDPYYIMDDSMRNPPPPAIDVDSIPVVRLDDMPPMPKGDDPRLASLRDMPIRRALPSFVVEKDGEMPANASPRSSQPVSGQQTPAPSISWSSSPAPTSSVPAYVVEDDADRPSTPEPIKVKSKKKATGTGKKKRTAKPEGNGAATPN